MIETSMTLPPPKQAGVSRTFAALWKHRWFALVVTVILGLAAWQIARIVIGTAVAVDQVKRGDLIQTVVASGHVETPFRVEIGSQITGTVADVLVDEGQHVTKGQPLISLDSRELNASMIEAQAAVAQAEARVQQLKELTLPAANEALKQAQANLLNAQATFDRTAELARNGHATQASVDDAQKNLDVARTQVRTAELQVYSSSRGGGDYVLAQTQLNQAHASLDTANARLGYTTITAPRDGVLITRNVERGTVVQPGKALLVLAPAGETQLDLQIDERNLGMISLKQTALASADAYPDQRFNAIVSYINPAVDISRASVDVKLTVPDPPAYLRQDMTVSVDIEVARRNATLVLPTRSVHDTQSAKPWVLAVRNGRAHTEPVRVGLRGSTQVEIVSGLSEGDLIVPATSGILNGQRVRPIAP